MDRMGRAKKRRSVDELRKWERTIHAIAASLESGKPADSAIAKAIIPDASKLARVEGASAPQRPHDDVDQERLIRARQRVVAELSNAADEFLAAHVPQADERRVARRALLELLLDAADLGVREAVRVR
jgi:hypothetical protein